MNDAQNGSRFCYHRRRIWVWWFQFFFFIWVGSRQRRYHSARINRQTNELSSHIHKFIAHGLKGLYNMMTSVSFRARFHALPIPFSTQTIALRAHKFNNIHNNNPHHSTIYFRIFRVFDITHSQSYSTAHRAGKRRNRTITTVGKDGEDSGLKEMRKNGNNKSSNTLTHTNWNWKTNVCSG